MDRCLLMTGEDVTEGTLAEITDLYRRMRPYSRKTGLLPLRWNPEEKKWETLTDLVLGVRRNDGT